MRVVGQMSSYGLDRLAYRFPRFQCVPSKDLFAYQVRSVKVPQTDSPDSQVVITRWLAYGGRQRPPVTRTSTDLVESARRDLPMRHRLSCHFWQYLIDWPAGISQQSAAFAGFHAFMIRLFSVGKAGNLSTGLFSISHSSRNAGG